MATAKATRAVVNMAAKATICMATAVTTSVSESNMPHMMNGTHPNMELEMRRKKWVTVRSIARLRK